MRVEMVKRAADVLFDVPGDAHQEIILLIDAVSEIPKPQAPTLAAAFSDSCWLVYTVRGDVVEILDVGCVW
ncbi:hypothetical protein FE633_15160 [Streptomyces montanus]|uniref:Uncharacterized protein n=1 Tax=Streptomyces montanus TaxID=2580423 RepID=A0A5R9FPT1_9ACTN|nr:hypothetical protein [Streptomyces montanus]TLS45401.1 hypothetical protein FE633_15160 [Streptomyces montanus]